MTTIQSKCKFCQDTIYLECDPECPQEWTDVLLPFASCNRCGDYFRSRRTLTEHMQRIATLLEQNTMTKEKAMGILVALTRSFANAFSKFHRSKTVVFSDEFARLIVDRPDKLMAILRGYREQAKAQFQRV